ncbi:MAG TPA: glucokinase [Dongiaceae bacterium]
MLNGPVLVADIGGTNARFAIAHFPASKEHGPKVEAIENLSCADFNCLHDAASTYLKKIGVRPVGTVVAVAGPVTGDRALITNLNWPVTHDELRQATGAESVLLVNDFEALALSVPLLQRSDLRQIGGTEPVVRAAKAVVGPGTGLGVGGLVWSAGRWLPIPGEGGHTSFAAETTEEFAIVEHMRGELEHFSNERVLSGPGLVSIYGALASRSGKAIATSDAQVITQRGLSGEDPLAAAALEFFVTALGRVAGDTALMLGARGGVYLGGGIPPKIQDALAKPLFRAAFESKGRLSAFVRPIPIYVILAGDTALRGAAVALDRAIEDKLC